VSGGVLRLQMSVDRATVERLFLSANPMDPFARTPLSREAIKPNEPLRRKAEEWLRRRGGSTPEKGAKGAAGATP
jgi:hypothetical protein